MKREAPEFELFKEVATLLRRCAALRAGVEKGMQSHRGQLLEFRHRCAPNKWSGREPPIRAATADKRG